eukprot:gene29334-36511_t
MLTLSNLKKIKEVEEMVKSVPGYSNFCFRKFNTSECQPPLSIGSVQLAVRQEVLADPNGTLSVMLQAELGAERGSGLYPSDEDFIEIAKQLPLISSYYSSPLFGSGHDVTWFFDEHFVEGTSETCVAMRSAFVFALPLEGYDSPSDRRSEQVAAYARFASQFRDMLNAAGGNELRVLHAGGEITEQEIKDIVKGDLLYAVGSLIVALLVILLHTRSVWITATAVLGLALSFPTSYFVFRVVCGVRYITFMCAA